MKKVTALLLYVLVFIAAPFAQKALKPLEGEIRWSEVIEHARKFLYDPKIIGSDSKYVYFIRIRNGKKFIEKYNTRSLQFEKSLKFELKHENNELEIVHSFMYNNGPVLYTKYYNRLTKTNYNFVHTVDTSTLIASKPILFSKIVMPEISRMESLLRPFGTVSNGVLLVSEDNSLSYTTDFAYKNIAIDSTNLMRNLNGTLYDENFKVLDIKQFKLPFGQFHIQNINLSNDKKLYIAGNEFKTKVEKESLKKTYLTEYGDLKILILDLQAGDFDVLEIPLDDGNLESFIFKINSDGSLIMSGLISHGNGGVSGGFYAKYNAKLEQESLNFIDFEDDFMALIGPQKSEITTKGYDLFRPLRLAIRDLVVKPDGTTTLLAEIFYINMQSTSGANGVSYSLYTYHYEDIIALNFDKKGELIWKTVINKYQVSHNDHGYYSSFFTILQGNDINIIYNEYKSKMVDTENMSYSERKKVNQSIIGKRVLLSSTGEQSSEILFEFEDDNMRLVPRECGHIDQNTAFLYGRSTVGDRIGFIEW